MMGTPGALIQTEPAPAAISPAGRAGADGNGRHDFVGRGIDARDGAVAAIERPHAAFAHRQASRLRPDLDRLDDLVVVRIHPRQHACRLRSSKSLP